MRMLMKTLLVLSGLLFVGCGGGGTTDTSSNGKIKIPEEIKTIDVENNKKVKITRANALELLDSSILAIPAGLERYEYDELLSLNYDQDVSCSTSGKVVVTTNVSKRSIEFDYQNCNDGEGVIMDGIVYTLFTSFVRDKEEGYFIVKNFKLSTGNESVVMDVQSDTRVNEEGSRVNHYNVEVQNLQNNEVFKYNYMMTTSSTERSIEGVFLLPDNTYFTLKSKNLKNGNGIIPLIGGANLDFYSGMVGPGQIILSGESSELVYQKVDGRDYYRLRENLDEIKPYYLTDSGEWTTNLEDIIASETTGQLYVSIIDKNETVTPYSYNPYYNYGYDDNPDTRLPDWQKASEKESHLNIRVSDEDQYGEYIVEIEPISIPSDSNFSMQKTTHLLDYIFDYTGEFEREADVAINHLVTFDKNGIYKFKITLHDGDSIVERLLIVEYYNGKLSATEEKLPYLVLKRDYVSSSGERIILTADQLLVIDKAGNQKSLNVPNAIDMALSEDNLAAYIVAGEDVFKVDLQSMSVDKTFAFKNEAFQNPLDHIVASSDNIYVFNRFDVFHIDTDTGCLVKVLGGLQDMKIIIHDELKRLYVAFTSFGDIFSFNMPLHPSSEGSPTTFSSSDNIYFSKNIWQFNEKYLITSSAELVNTNDDNTTDLTSAGYLDELDIEHTSDDLIFYAQDKASQKKLFIQKQLQSEYYVDDIDGQGPGIVDPSSSYFVYVLSIYSSDMKLEHEEVLRKDYVDEDNKRYRLLIKDAYFIDNTKVSLLYEAKEITTEFDYDTVSDDVSFYIEDTKNITRSISPEIVKEHVII